MTRTDVPVISVGDAGPLGRRILAHVRLLRAIYGPDEMLDFAESEIPQEEPNWPPEQT